MCVIIDDTLDFIAKNYKSCLLVIVAVILCICCAGYQLNSDTSDPINWRYTREELNLPQLLIDSLNANDFATTKTFFVYRIYHLPGGTIKLSTDRIQVGVDERRDREYMRHLDYIFSAPREGRRPINDNQKGIALVIEYQTRSIEYMLSLIRTYIRTTSDPEKQKPLFRNAKSALHHFAIFIHSLEEEHRKDEIVNDMRAESHILKKFISPDIWLWGCDFFFDSNTPGVIDFLVQNIKHMRRSK